MSARALLEIKVPARVESLKSIRDAVSMVLNKIGVENAMCEQLKLVVDEAAANVIRHAYTNCDDGFLSLCVRRTRGRLRFTMRDHAPCVDLKKIKLRERSTCHPGGLGLHFINDIMDRWTLRPLRRGGNVLVMTKHVRLK